MIFGAMYLFAAPSTGTIGAIFAVAFFLMLAGAAYVAFRILHKTAKLGIRAAVVGMILFIALAGSLSLWWFSQGGTPKLKAPPAAPRKR